MALDEYLPITSVSLLPNRSAEIAGTWIFQEELRGFAYVFATVSTAGTPATVREGFFTQLHLYQYHRSTVVSKPAPQHHVDSRRLFVADGPLAINLAEQTPRWNPLEAHFVDDQLDSDDLTDMLG